MLNIGPGCAAQCERVAQWEHACRACSEHVAQCECACLPLYEALGLILSIKGQKTCTHTMCVRIFFFFFSDSIFPSLPTSPFSLAESPTRLNMLPSAFDLGSGIGSRLCHQHQDPNSPRKPGPSDIQDDVFKGLLKERLLICFSIYWRRSPTDCALWMWTLLGTKLCPELPLAHSRSNGLIKGRLSAFDCLHHSNPWEFLSILNAAAFICLASTPNGFTN